jgi:hypothetical protein
MRWDVRVRTTRTAPRKKVTKFDIPKCYNLNILKYLIETTEVVYWKEVDVILSVCGRVRYGRAGSGQISGWRLEGGLQHVRKMLFVISSFYTAIFKPTILFEPVFQVAKFGSWIRNRGDAITPLVFLRNIVDKMILDSYGIRSSCTFPFK